jgi:thymidylate synthase
LYNNTIDQAKTQIQREPFSLPKLVIKRKPDSIFDYQFEDFEIVDYQAHPHIKAQVSV